MDDKKMRFLPFWDFYWVSNCNSVTTFRDDLSVHLEGSSSSRRMSIFEGKEEKRKDGVTSKVVVVYIYIYIYIFMDITSKVVVSTATREQTDIYIYIYIYIYTHN